MSVFLRSTLIFTVVLFTSASQTIARSHVPRYDIVIKNGTMLSEDAPLVVTDLAIAGGRIVAMGQVDATRAKRTIDARGLTMTSGVVSWQPGNCGAGGQPFATLGPPVSSGHVEERGRLRVGSAADVTVADPVSARDRRASVNLSACGAEFRFVLVNGQIVVDDGLPTASRRDEVPVQVPEADASL